MGNKTILVTGGAGYVGSGLLRVLLAKGYKVICVDFLKFGGESLLEINDHPNFIFHNLDIRNYKAFDKVLESEKIDVVIHLASIVGDPACKAEPKLAHEIMWDASKRLIDRSIEIGIDRFAFASTCSNYGKMKGAYVDELSELAPVSLYAELKVKLEKYILESLERTSMFSPVSLRFSTVYGLSPRMRFDLTVNEFTKIAALGLPLNIFGEQFWRPYCHVQDFSNAFMKIIEAPREKIAYKVYNVGDTTENYSKRMIVDELQKIFPNIQVSFTPQIDDPRDYRVNCDSIKHELGFEITKRVPDGIKEIANVVVNGIISNPDDQKYYNIKHLV
jgi:nucleoside-diphosphate-sugar epimerase